MDEFTTPYEDDDAQFIECKVWWLNLTIAVGFDSENLRSIV